MINYELHIQPFEAQHSDDHIAIYCNTLCNRPINCSELRVVCAAADVVTVDSDQKYIGPLVSFLFSPMLPTSPVNLQKLARWFFQHVWKDQAQTLSIDGHSVTPGISGFDVVLGFGVLTKTAEQANPAFVPLVEKMVVLAGGFVYPESLTAADVAASRQAYQSSQALQELKQQWLAEDAQRWNAHVEAINAYNGVGPRPVL